MPDIFEKIEEFSNVNDNKFSDPKVAALKIVEHQCQIQKMGAEVFLKFSAVLVTEFEKLFSVQNQYTQTIWSLLVTQCRTSAMSAEEIVLLAQRLTALLGGESSIVPESESGVKHSYGNSMNVKHSYNEHSERVYELLVDPATAIGEEKIYCCICGQDLKLISRAHLAKHGLTKEKYLAICGYPANTALMGTIIREQKADRVSKNHAAWLNGSGKTSTDEPSNDESVTCKPPVKRRYRKKIDTGQINGEGTPRAN